MDRSPELSILFKRLDKLSQRMANARAGFAASHPEFESDLSTFIDRRDSILSLIDETNASSVIATAEKATEDMESGLEHWLKSIDESYNKPLPRKNSVSM